MRKHTVRMFGLTTALLFAAAAAQAQGKGHGKGHDKGHDDDRDEDRGSQVVNGQIVNGQGQVVNVDPRRQGTAGNRDPRRQGTMNGDPRRQGTIYNGDPRRQGDVYQDNRDDRDERGGRRRVPPGLAKKPGGMPPGQYKKMYGTNQGADMLSTVMRQRGYTVVRTQPYGSSQYVYYRLRDGGMQRAIVSPGTDRLQFSNVPASLLNEVLSRLY